MENYNTNDEVWKDVIGYEGLYEVSNVGNVRSKDRVIVYSNGIRVPYEGNMKTQVMNKYGYNYVGLHKDAKSKQGMVHRLVADAFIPREEGKNHVNHKDGVKTNNHASNLEWCTPQENVKHAVETGLLKDVVGVNHYKTKLTEDMVKEIRKRSSEGETYRALADEFGLVKSTIGFIVNRKTWKHVK